MTTNGNKQACEPERLVRQIISGTTPKNWLPSGMGKADYLDVMESIVRMAAEWLDERGAIIDPVLNREWAQTTPRFVSSGAILLANGRIADLKEKVLRSMDYACREFTAPDIRERSSDFWMRELVTAFCELRPQVEAERAEMWRRNLALVVPERHYRHFYPDEELQKKCNNWVVHSACGELLREYADIGGVKGTLWGRRFFETYMRWQTAHFNEWGMYLDPGQPITYDLTTRLQFAAAFECAYRSPLRDEITALLDKGDFVTLLEVSSGGEAPFGGRSSQFYFQEAIICALCEAAARKYKEVEPRLAGAFKRQARLSAAVTRRGFCRKDGKRFHIKNQFSQDTLHGCDDYGQYSVYSLLTASLLSVAARFADDSIAEFPTPSEIGGFGFAVTGTFEKSFLNANGGFLQFDLLADPHYDATGLGRVILKGMPWGVLPVLPFAASPKYILAPGLPRTEHPTAIAPEWLDKNGNAHRLAEKNTASPGVMEMLDNHSCQVQYLHDGVTVGYRATMPEPGVLMLSMKLDGDFTNAHLVIPILETDGALQPRTNGASSQILVDWP
ncbi:MAG: hypothetical protein IJJ33_10755, partial [Victivallales bacterium]|nr:hypothetical protein [Victivallales bacterium]